METMEVEVQEFDGKEYILYNTVIYNGDYFDVYSCTDNPEDIKVYKQIKENEEVYYEKATNDEYVFVISQCA